MTKTNADCDNRPEGTDERLDLGTNDEDASVDAKDGFERLDATIERSFARLNATIEREFASLNAAMGEGFDRIDAALAKLRADFRQMRWMATAVFLGVAYLIIKDLLSG